MSLKIDQIVLHHAGGLGNDKYASTKHLTVQHIDNAHKTRWEFPSQFMKKKDGTPYYAGYSVIYDPKDRSFTQTRAIGEETAHAVGANFSSVGLCIIGNFMRRPMSNPSAPVDPLTKQIEDDIVLFLHDLINGNKRGLAVLPGTIVELAIERVRPHRFYQTTECYGTGIADSHFRDLLIQYKPVVVTAPDGKTKEQILEERNKLMQTIMVLIAQISALTERLKQLGGRRRVGSTDRSCPGHSADY